MWYEKFATLFPDFFEKLEVIAAKSLRHKGENISIIFTKLWIINRFFAIINYSVYSVVNHFLSFWLIFKFLFIILHFNI